MTDRALLMRVAEAVRNECACAARDKGPRIGANLAAASVDLSSIVDRIAGERVTCSRCRGSGAEDHLVHGDGGVEAIRCERCGGFGTGERVTNFDTARRLWLAFKAIPRDGAGRTAAYGAFCAAEENAVLDLRAALRKETTR